MKPTTRHMFVALMLAAAMLLSYSLFSLPAAAEDTVITSAEPSRFIGESFYGSDGTTHHIEKDRIVLPIGTDNQSIAYSTSVTPTVYATENNAVRVVLSNDSSANFILVRYTYDSEGDLNTETVRMDIEPYSEKCAYSIRIPQADDLTAVTLLMPGCEGNSITLYAMETVRIWSDFVTPRGSLSSCLFREETRTVTVKGSVYHDVMIAAGGGVLGLFRLSPEQTLQDIVDDPQIEPLVTSSLSISFELQTTATDVVARYARYAVMICLPDGTRLPLAAPAYATVSQSVLKSQSSRSDFKGVDTTLISGAIDSNVGSAIVDVYLNRMENERQSGYLYTVENQYFYFNREYIAELDAIVRSLSGAACQVYLRFLVEAENTALACAATVDEQNSTVKYRSLRADDTEALRYLHAYTTFLCNRYNGGGQGEIAGIIVGSRVNEAATYNASDAMTLAEYVPLYGQALHTVSTAASSVDSSMVIIVPVSDLWNVGMVGQSWREGSYSAEMFAESLAAYMTAYRGIGFSLMIESDHNPYGLSNAYFEPINTDGEEGPIPEELIPKLIAATQDSTYLSSENIGLLDTFLKIHHTAQSALSDTYFFHWTPDKHTDGNALSTSYIYHYYRLFADPAASAFFVSFREREMTGDLDEFSKIKYLVKYIDTSYGSNRTEFAREILETESWSDLIPGFDREKTEQMTLVEGAFGEPIGDSIAGSYSLFDFSTANSTRGWYAGNYCHSLAVTSTQKYGKTLSAVMTADTSTLAEYSDIAYRFETPLSITYAPYITMQMAVDCPTDSDAVFEIKLVIGSDTGYMEAKQVVKNGEIATVTLNATRFAELNKVSYIRLSVKTVMGSDESYTLHLGHITLDSREYDTDTIAAWINASRFGTGQIRTESGRGAANPKLTVILGGAILLGTVIVGVVLGHYQKNDNDPGEEET